MSDLAASTVQFTLFRNIRIRNNALRRKPTTGSKGKLTLGYAQHLARASYGKALRPLELVLGVLMFVIASPLMLLIALAVKLNSSGPVIISQNRITRSGRVFPMFKFRTMKDNCESTSGAVWAASEDSRVTAVGRILRPLHLDELPQLLNVIRGEMSLVGPRPERPELASLLRAQLHSYDLRHRVNAGITGLAQIRNGYANDLSSYRRKVAFDRLYVANRCLTLDLLIVLGTIRHFVTQLSSLKLG